MENIKLEIARLDANIASLEVMDDEEFLCVEGYVEMLRAERNGLSMALDLLS